MKNKSLSITHAKSNGFFAFLIFLFVAFSGIPAFAGEGEPKMAPPPCPMVKNDIGCNVVVKIEVFNSCPLPSTPCYMTTTGISMYNSIPSGCTNGTCGSSACEIRVTVISVGGVPQSPQPFATMSTPSSFFTACGIPIHIFYDNTYNEFFIQP